MSEADLTKLRACLRELMGQVGDWDGKDADELDSILDGTWMPAIREALL